MTLSKIQNILLETPTRFTTLQKILKKSSLQREWTKQVSSLLKGPLKQEIKVINVYNDKLVILCANSSVATQIKFLEPELIEKLNSLSNFNLISQIKIRVNQN